MKTTNSEKGSQRSARKLRKEAQFNGVELPRENWFKTPNALIDALPLFSTKAELCVVLYVLRHTWGYQEAFRKITLDEFENGRKRANGTRLDKGVGMNRQAIISGIKRAVEHGFLHVISDESDGGRIKKYYALNLIDGE